MSAEASARNRQLRAEARRWEEKFMQLYAERAIQATTQDGAVRGQMGPGEEIGFRNVEAQVTRPSLTADETELFLEARRREKQSLDSQDIPPDVKKAVQKYFDSIEVIKP